MGGDEDERRRAMGPGQLLLEFKAAHPRHPYVDDQACCVRQMIGLQKVLRRGPHLHSQPNRAQKTLEGLAYGCIIVDYGN
jgi:hypothetical protein